MSPAPGKYSDETRFRLLRNGCEEDEDKLELVDSLEYWTKRLKVLSWNRFAEKKEAREAIEKYEKWIADEGIKEKMLPPARAIPPSDAVDPYSPYGKTSYEQINHGAHKAVILDPEKLEQTKNTELKRYIAIRQLDIYRNFLPMGEI